MSKLTEFLGIAFSWDTFEIVDSAKENKLETLIDQKDTIELLAIGINQGFLNDQLRFKAYEVLLEIQNYQVSENLENSNIVKDIYVIENDVHRSLNVDSQMRGKTWTQKDYFRSNLKETLLRFFIKNKRYNYFQGFNSVTERLVTTFRKENAFCVLEKISKLYFKDSLIDGTFNNAIYKFQERMLEMMANQAKMEMSEE